MDSMYDILMDLPMFRGVSRERWAEVIGKTKFHFLKYLEGETVVSAGDDCTQIKFILSGSVRSTIASTDDRFRVSQTLTSPEVIMPEFLFGRNTKYPCTVVALDTVNIVQIPKADYLSLLVMDQIFLFNFLNVLSMNAQKSIDGVLSVTMGSLEERIAFWIIALTQPNGKDIELECKHRDLYSLFGVQRSSFIASLDKLKERGIIEYTTNKIEVKNRRELKNLLE